MHWGGVDNTHRQKRTFEWIERNADEISAKLSNAIDLIKDEQASLDSFDGVNLIMNSTMTKIVSLADPEQKLVIYDGRVGGALGYFCGIRGNAATDSDGKRPPNPIESDHLIRTKATTLLMG
jgi:hypothetical protein